MEKKDFFYSKLLSGPVKFSAVVGPEEFKGSQLLDLLAFVIHWSDLIEISGNDMLVNDDQKAAEIKQRLIAAGFSVEQFKVGASQER